MTTPDSPGRMVKNMKAWIAKAEERQKKIRAERRKLAPKRIDREYGNGYSEPHEYWIDCACGEQVWNEGSYYHDKVEPDPAWAEHVKWHEEGKP